jgi:hypothetical protein
VNIKARRRKMRRKQRRRNNKECTISQNEFNLLTINLYLKDS